MAIRMGYLGENYHGYQRQPGLSTVEGQLIDALKESGIIPGPEEANFASAARTDKGANAIYQVIALDPSQPVVAVCKRLNSKLPNDIFCLGVREVDDGFHPRRDVVSKTYLYLLDGNSHRLDSLEETSRLFLGEHDFSQFSRPCGRRPVRSIDDIRIENLGGMVGLFFTSKGFLWMQVRKMVSALMLMESGRMGRDVVERALDGQGSLSLAPAPPQNLVLWHIDYGEMGPSIEPKASGTAKEFLDRSIRMLEMKLAVRRSLLAAL